MSSENDEVVAGHPPAVKVGGMRVASRPKHHEQDADAYDEKYEESLPEPTNAVHVAAPVAISGAPVKGNSDFPVEALKHVYDKPHPTREKHHAESPTKNCRTHNQVFQPQGRNH